MKKNNSKESISPQPDNKLIVFSKNVNITLSVLFLLYFILSFSKIHTSSVAVWDQVFGIKKSKSVLLGTPKAIRQDEWMVGTPSIVSQCLNGFPIRNQTFGEGNVPVMNGMPVKDFTMVLRPSLWAFFFLDTERAFAFNWNFNIFIFLISQFLFFLLITRNNFWLSLIGSVFIFSSAAMQWWSYTLGTPMIYLNGIVISFAFLIFSRDIKVLLLSGIVFLVSSYNFLVSLYPPWQVPLVYLYLFTFIGFIIPIFNLKTIKEKLWLKAGILAIALTGLIIFGWHYYGLVKETYAILLDTVYPGRRTTNGGDLIDGKLFSGFFDVFMNDTQVPAKWLNICEASSFILFFPIVFYSMGYTYYKSKKINPMLLLLASYVLVLLVWILIGFPEILSKISLFSSSPVYRTLPVFGVVNSFLLICFLANKENDEETKFSWAEFGILAILIFVFVTFIGSHINESTDNFFKPGQLTGISILFTIVYLLIRYKHLQYVQIGLAIILLGINIPQLKVNPITKGLAPLMVNDIVKLTKEISQSDPYARWAVFGQPILTHLLKINGINVFNGVKSVPILKDMQVLDPSGKNNSVYNRYAHINMGPYIDFKDTIVFKLNENAVVNDNYSIFMDPCSPKLEKLGVRYFLFTYEPKPEEIRCMTPILITGPFIYKR